VSCCNEQLAKSVCLFANEIHHLARELHEWRKHLFPLPAPDVEEFGQTRLVDQEIVDMAAVMKYEQDVKPLPPKTGRNADIAFGTFVVVTDGTEYSRQRVDYDLDTREPLAAVPWKSPKGADVTLKMSHTDDDNNESPFVESHFGIATDTIAPDAPTELGVTRVIEEVDEV